MSSREDELLDVPASAKASDGSRPASARLWALAIVAAAAAGFASWRGGESVVEYFQPAMREVDFYGKVTQKDPVSELAADAKNAALAFAILGGSLGLLLGLAGGLAGGRAPLGLAAGFAGLLLGAAAGGWSAWASVRAFQRYYEVSTDNLLAPLPYHLGTWTAIGATAGLALGLGLGTRGAAARGLIGGAVGGLVGAILFQLAGAAAFPLDQVFRPLSFTPPSRLGGRMAAALSVAVGAVLGVALTARRRPSSASP